MQAGAGVPLFPPEKDDLLMTDTDIAAGSTLIILLSCLCVVAALAVHLAITWWIYNDANKRGNPNAVVWALLNFISDPLGLILYLIIGRNQTTPLGGPPPTPPPPQGPARL
jgi:hypothetical protein